MDGGAWWATVHGVAKSRTQLSDFPSQYRGFNLIDVIQCSKQSVTIALRVFLSKSVLVPGKYLIYSLLLPSSLPTTHILPSSLTQCWITVIQAYSIHFCFRTYQSLSPPPFLEVTNATENNTI